MLANIFEKYPLLQEEWDCNKNTVPLDDKVRGYHKAWWIAPCGHSWKTMISDRVKRDGNMSGCPYCADPPKLLKGFNDMWVTNPELASMLANPEDGYTLMQNSKKLLDWKCLNCDNIIKNKRVNNVKNFGLSCHFCSPLTSTPERIMSNFLKEADLDFEFQKSFNWLKGRLYDFYLPKYDVIIETHGRRHYSNSHEGELEKLQRADAMKEDMAMKNNVEDYIIVNCSRNNIDYIKSSIENSTLMRFITKNCQWHIIAQNSATEKMRNTWDLWNNGMNMQEISTHTNIDITTVCEYLKHGYMARECSYTVRATKINTHSKRAIVQLSINKEYIRTWDSLKDAAKSLGINHTSQISMCINHHIQEFRGFKWMYLNEYENSI